MKRTEATKITLKVREEVMRRDGQRCILCGSPNATPSCHFIKRSHMGMGKEQNIVTLCHDCHLKFDSSKQSIHVRAIIRDYLRGIYPHWNEYELKYRKGEQ